MSMHPYDPIRVIIPASAIPDQSVVTKKGGTYPHTFRRGLIIYADKTLDAKPQKIDGFFLINDAGGINQISPITELIVEMRAESLLEWLEGELDHPDNK
jgi:hypothetical protein